GEFNLTWMLHTPDTKTLPVGLADTYASLRIEIGSAYTILFFIMTMPLLVAMQWLGVDATAQRSAARANNAARSPVPSLYRRPRHETRLRSHHAHTVRENVSWHTCA